MLLWEVLPKIRDKLIPGERNHGPRSKRDKKGKRDGGRLRTVVVWKVQGTEQPFLSNVSAPSLSGLWDTSKSCTIYPSPRKFNQKEQTSREKRKQSQDDSVIIVSKNSKLDLNCAKQGKCRLPLLYSSQQNITNQKNPLHVLKILAENGEFSFMLRCLVPSRG